MASSIAPSWPESYLRPDEVADKLNISLEELDTIIHEHGIKTFRFHGRTYITREKLPRLRQLAAPLTGAPVCCTACGESISEAQIKRGVIQRLVGNQKLNSKRRLEIVRALFPGDEGLLARVGTTTKGREEV
jgi:hypothetical protein